MLSFVPSRLLVNEHYLKELFTNVSRSSSKPLTAILKVSMLALLDLTKTCHQKACRKRPGLLTSLIVLVSHWSNCPGVTFVWSGHLDMPRQCMCCLVTIRKYNNFETDPDSRDDKMNTYTAYANDSQIYNSIPDLYINCPRSLFWLIPTYLKSWCFYTSFPLLL